MSFRRFLPAAALVLLLAGCTPTAAAPTASPSGDPSPSASPSPSAEPAAHTSPSPALELTCGELADEDSLATALNNAVTLRDEPLAGLAVGSGPLAHALAQLGGLNCYWGNDKEPQETTGNPNPEYTALHVQLLPDATADDRNRLGDGEGCSASGTGRIGCVRELMVGSSWLHVTATGVRGTDSSQAAATVAPLLDGIESAIESASERPFSWAPPADTVPLTGECEQLLDGAAATAIFETETPLVVGRAGGGWSLEAASWARFDALPCHILFQDADIGTGYITWLPGGDWAYPSDDADAELVEADGLEGDDRLIVNCRPTLASRSCSADLAVGHNWIRVVTYQAANDASPSHDYEIAPRDSAVAVAEAILARLRG